MIINSSVLFISNLLDKFDIDMDFDGFFIIPIIPIIFGIVFVVVLTFSLITFFKSKKKADQVFDETIEQIKEKVKDINEQKKDQREEIVCAYCGNALDQNDKKCPNCGAAKNKK